MWFVPGGGERGRKKGVIVCALRGVVQVGVLVAESGGADWLREREVPEEEGRRLAVLTI